MAARRLMLVTQRQVRHTSFGIGVRHRCSAYPVRHTSGSTGSAWVFGIPFGGHFGSMEEPLHTVALLEAARQYSFTRHGQVYMHPLCEWIHQMWSQWRMPMSSLFGIPLGTFFGTVFDRPVRHTPLVVNPYQKWLSCQALRHRCSAYPFGIPLVAPVRHRCSAYPLEGVLEAKRRLDLLTVPNYFRICGICRRGGM